MALMIHLQSPIDTKLTGFRFVAHMAGLDEHQVLTVMGIRPMAVGCHNPTDHTVIKGKRAEVLGNQNDGEALILIGAEGP